jgi:CRISPR-associated protein Cas1
MTVAGQKNHYNVKLLRGYGVSINLKDNRICLKSGRDPLTGEQETEEWFVTQIPYERIVISGKGYLSTEAVPGFAKKDIGLNINGNILSVKAKREKANY